MLATHILATVEPQRLLKATEGLVNGAFIITVTCSEEDSLEGFVKNGDNVEYAVAITPARTFCSCKDSMFRHSVCKHSVALALPLPPILLSIARTNGHIGLRFSSLSNLTYSIQASTNLVNWEMLGTATDSANGQYQFEDTNTSNFKRRFYRTAF